MCLIILDTAKQTAPQVTVNISTNQANDRSSGYRSNPQQNARNVRIQIFPESNQKIVLACPMCPETTATKKDLQDHLALVHDFKTSKPKESVNLPCGSNHKNTTPVSRNQSDQFTRSSAITVKGISRNTLKKQSSPVYKSQQSKTKKQFRCYLCGKEREDKQKLVFHENLHTLQIQRENNADAFASILRTIKTSMEHLSDFSTALKNVMDSKQHSIEEKQKTIIGIIKTFKSTELKLSDINMKFIFKHVGDKSKHYIRMNIEKGKKMLESRLTQLREKRKIQGNFADATDIVEKQTAIKNERAELAVSLEEITDLDKQLGSLERDTNILTSGNVKSIQKLLGMQRGVKRKRTQVFENQGTNDQSSDSEDQWGYDHPASKQQKTDETDFPSCDFVSSSDQTLESNLGSLSSPVKLEACNDEYVELDTLRFLDMDNGQTTEQEGDQLNTSTQKMNDIKDRPNMMIKQENFPISNHGFFSTDVHDSVFSSTDQKQVVTNTDDGVIISVIAGKSPANDDDVFDEFQIERKLSDENFLVEDGKTSDLSVKTEHFDPNEPEVIPTKNGNFLVSENDGEIQIRCDESAYPDVKKEDVEVKRLELRKKMDILERYGYEYINEKEEGTSHVSQLNEDNGVASRAAHLQQCTECGLIFDTKDQLETHASQKHGCFFGFGSERRPLFRCGICLFQYLSNELLQIHLTTHSIENDKSYRTFMEILCGKCQKKCKDIWEYKQHDQQKHAAKAKRKAVLECYVCGMRFNEKQDLQKHEATHSLKQSIKQSKNVCVTCQKNIRRIGNQCYGCSRIKIKHIKKSKWLCQSCGLVKRKRVLSGAAKCKCTRKQFRKHKRLVPKGGLTSYKFHCRFPKCGLTFETLQDKRAHFLALHFNDTLRNEASVKKDVKSDKPKIIQIRTCSDCGVGFMSEEALINHNQGMHGPVNDNIECNLCTRIFMNKSSFKFHEAFCHKVQYCSQCKIPCEGTNGVTKHSSQFHDKAQEVHTQPGPKVNGPKFRFGDSFTQLRNVKSSASGAKPVATGDRSGTNQLATSNLFQPTSQAQFSIVPTTSVPHNVMMLSNVQPIRPSLLTLGNPGVNSHLQSVPVPNIPIVSPISLATHPIQHMPHKDGKSSQQKEEGSAIIPQPSIILPIGTDIGKFKTSSVSNDISGVTTQNSKSNVFTSSVDSSAESMQNLTQSVNKGIIVDGKIKSQGKQPDVKDHKDEPTEKDVTINKHFPRVSKDKVCPDCNMTYTRRHTKCPKVNLLSCFLCGYKAGSKELLKEHEEVHLKFQNTGRGHYFRNKPGLAEKRPAMTKAGIMTNTSRGNSDNISRDPFQSCKQEERICNKVDRQNQECSMSIYECYLCGLKLKTKAHLQEHLEKTHNLQKSLPSTAGSTRKEEELCKHCNKVYTRYHKCTKPKWECYLCGLRLRTKVLLQAHEKTHVLPKSLPVTNECYLPYKEYEGYVAKKVEITPIAPSVSRQNKSPKSVPADFKCMYCSQTFSQIDLKRHIEAGKCKLAQKQPAEKERRQQGGNNVVEVKEETDRDTTIVLD